MQLIVMVMAGLLFRLIGIIKPEGLWNDEYVSWSIAATPFSDGFIEAIKAQCHMPLYYLYLKSFMAWLGQSDLILRLSSVIAGIAAIVVMYFVGKQKDKKTAVISSAITAFSSFLIYYSQEVRIYSLLFLFSAFSLLYFIRYIKNKNITAFAGLIIFDFLIMFTHTIGFVFVFFQILGLSVIIFKERKKQVLALWISILALTGILAPNIIHIFTKSGISQWWGSFSLSKIGFLLTDYFSPVLTNLVNAPDNFIYHQSLSFIFFTIIPAIIAFGFIIKSVIKNKERMLLIIIAICTVCVLIIAAVMGKLVFITKYSIEIYPILIFLMACGISDTNNKFIKYALISLFFGINIFYLTFSPVSAPKMPRPQGHKLVADLLKNGEIKDGDILLFEYYAPDRFSKYIDLNKYKTYSINKGDFYLYLKRNSTYEDAKQNGKQEYKELLGQNWNVPLEYFLQEEIYSKMNKSQSLFVIVNDSVAVYSEAGMQNILSDENVYEKIPLLYLIFSYIKNYSYAYFSQHLSISRVEKLGDWSVIKFTKLNN